MCGIFGFSWQNRGNLSFADSKAALSQLFLLSEQRGKEAAGIAIKNKSTKQIGVLKQNITASRFIRQSSYENFLDSNLKPAFGQGGLEQGVSVIAHTRLVTNGDRDTNVNNQPVTKPGGVIVHNGIVVNVDDLWAKYPDIKRELYVDSEVLLALILHFSEQGMTLPAAVAALFNEVKGSASVALHFTKLNVMVLATNNGSLYYTKDDKGGLVFSSEQYILTRYCQWAEKHLEVNLKAPMRLHPGEGVIFDEDSKELQNFRFDDPPKQLDVHEAKPVYKIQDASQYSNDQLVAVPEKAPATQVVTKDVELLKFPLETFQNLNRCTKCVLPETFPFIRFNAEGVCNYCENYKLIYNPETFEAQKQYFMDRLDHFRSNGKKLDCLVPFSGGRDSSYGLHLLVHEYGMTPITYTYDWGMVTDLARRNIARMCGQLGIENILVSADITMKLRNIRNNVRAWLKKPAMGIIPLFMAGDKSFYYYCNKIRKQTGLELDLWMTNKLENTDFKTGYCGIAPEFGKSHVDKLGNFNKLHMISYYLKNFATNPGYFNSSLIDTFGSFLSYYVLPRGEHLLMFNYLKWDESTVESTLLDTYDWERSPDFSGTWRIGDGTASFYNYIYLTVGGFTENETFRSNQIREGMITREEALEKIFEENRPRHPSIQWYLERIGLPYRDAIEVINKIPKRYATRS